VPLVRGKWISKGVSVTSPLRGAHARLSAAHADGQGYAHASGGVERTSPVGPATAALLKKITPSSH